MVQEGLQVQAQQQLRQVGAVVQLDVLGSGGALRQQSGEGGQKGVGGLGWAKGPAEDVEEHPGSLHHGQLVSQQGVDQRQHQLKALLAQTITPFLQELLHHWHLQ